MWCNGSVPRLERGDRKFDSFHPDLYNLIHGTVAQIAERSGEIRKVIGAIPIGHHHGGMAEQLGKGLQHLSRRVQIPFPPLWTYGTVVSSFPCQGKGHGFKSR